MSVDETVRDRSSIITIHSDSTPVQRLQPIASKEQRAGDTPHLTTGSGAISSAGRVAVGRQRHAPRAVHCDPSTLNDSH